MDPVLMTLRESIWRWLVKNGPSRLLAICAAHPNATVDVVRSTCRHLRDDGYLLGTGSTHLRTYEAIGNKPPRDKRGTSPGSRMGLDIGRNRAIALQRARYGIKVEPNDRRQALWDVWPC